MLTPLNFRDIRKVKDTKKLFEKISDDMDSSLVRNSQAQRSKSQECEDANNALTAMRSCFAHTSLDYVFHVSTPIRERPVGWWILISNPNTRFTSVQVSLAYVGEEYFFLVWVWWIKAK